VTLSISTCTSTLSTGRARSIIESHLYIAYIAAAIAAMPRSSTSLTVVIGSLIAVPRHAHRIVRLSTSVQRTPSEPMSMSPSVIAFVRFGLILSR
jgi:hypothetical protein